MSTPAAGATRLAAVMASQTTCLAASQALRVFRESMGSLNGLGTEVQRAMARATETQALPTLREFDASSEFLTAWVFTSSSHRTGHENGHERCP